MHFCLKVILCETSEFTINTLNHAPLSLFSEKSGEIWTEWSDWSYCVKNWAGCYQSKHRICLSKNPKLCPEADKYGVQSIARKCQSHLCDGKWSVLMTCCIFRNFLHYTFSRSQNIPSNFWRMGEGGFCKT